jgi:hypothetical protein
VQSEAIFFRKDRNCGEFDLGGGAEDPDRNLAAIRHEQPPYRGRPSVRRSDRMLDVAERGCQTVTLLRGCRFDETA